MQIQEDPCSRRIVGRRGLIVGRIGNIEEG